MQRPTASFAQRTGEKFRSPQRTSLTRLQLQDMLRFPAGHFDKQNHVRFASLDIFSHTVRRIIKNDKRRQHKKVQSLECNYPFFNKSAVGARSSWR